MTLRFTPTPTGVQATIGGFDFPLSERQIDLMMDDLQAVEKRAEAQASAARKAFNDLWDARCVVMDAKHNARAAA